MQYTNVLEENHLHVMLNGTFTMTDSNCFLNILENIDRKVINTIKLDFLHTQCLDSSALGLLLLLRHEIQNRGLSVQLINVTGQVWKTLTLSQFDKLFDIV